MPEFVPEDDPNEQDIPFFEEATKEEHGVRGHASKKSIDDLKAELRKNVSRLKGSVIRIKKGKYPGEYTRYGYEVQFTLGGQPGTIPIAGLPMKNPTESKIEQTRKQALYTFNVSLENQLAMKYISPNSNPLLPYMLGPNNEKTLSEWYEQSDGVPQLSSGTDMQSDDVEEAAYEVAGEQP